MRKELGEVLFVHYLGVYAFSLEKYLIIKLFIQLLWILFFFHCCNTYQRTWNIHEGGFHFLSLSFSLSIHLSISLSFSLIKEHPLVEQLLPSWSLSAGEINRSPWGTLQASSRHFRLMSAATLHRHNPPCCYILEEPMKQSWVKRHVELIWAGRGTDETYLHCDTLSDVSAKAEKGGGGERRLSLNWKWGLCLGTW